MMGRAACLIGVVAVLAASAMAADWPQFQHDNNSTGITSGLGPVHNLTQKWSTSLYQQYGLNFQGASAPVVSNGTVYAYALGRWTGAGNEARLVALSATTGAVKWISARLQDEGGYGSHNGASVDPVTGDMYVASWNSLYRISGSNGSIVWQHTTASDPAVWGSNAVINGAPAIGAGKAFWATQSGGLIDASIMNHGNLIGVDLNAGSGGSAVSPSVSVAMPADVRGSSIGTPVIFQIDGQDYVATNYGRGYQAAMGGGIIVVNAATGVVRWSMSQAELGAGATDDAKAAYCFNGSMSYSNGVLYARSYDDQGGHTNNGTLWAISATSGSVIWKTQDQSTQAGTYDNAVNGHGAPIVVGDKVIIGGGTGYYGGTGQKVMAFSATSGARLWQVSDVGGWSNQMAYAGGYLYAGTEDWWDDYYNHGGMDKLTVLDMSGRAMAHFDGAGSSPAVAGGLVYTINAAGQMVAITGSLPGDANNDGEIDVADYTAWFNHYGMPNPAWEDGDMNGDGQIDVGDYTVWFNNYGAKVGGTTTPVPEPATVSLAVLAMAGLLRRKRRED